MTCECCSPKNMSLFKVFAKLGVNGFNKKKTIYER